MTERRHMAATITAEERAEWRALQSSGMESAVGEYTPAAFWELLDAYEALLAATERPSASEPCPDCGGHGYPL